MWTVLSTSYFPRAGDPQTPAVDLAVHSYERLSGVQRYIGLSNLMFSAAAWLVAAVAAFCGLLAVRYWQRALFGVFVLLTWSVTQVSITRGPGDYELCGNLGDDD